MITKQQAIDSAEFHEDGCVRAVGPRGGVTTSVKVWRRNGKTQTWARSPERRPDWPRSRPDRDLRTLPPPRQRSRNSKRG